MTPSEELTGSPLVPYAIGDPGRAAREVVPKLARDATFPADIRVDGGDAGPLRVRAASRRGLLHAYDGRPRQDDYALWADARWLVIAVADGVSSAPLSHEAAELCCRNSIVLMEQVFGNMRELREVPWGRVIERLAQSVVDRGRRIIGRAARPATVDEIAAQWATTIVIVVLDQHPQVAGYHEGAFVAVGDSAVYALDRAHGWERLSPGKRDAAGVVSNATEALPMMAPGAPEAMSLRLPRGEALFVMTDGVSDPLGAGDGPVGDQLGRLWAAPPDALTFCGQVGFARRTFDDDRTVVGIWAS